MPVSRCQLLSFSFLAAATVAVAIFGWYLEQQYYTPSSPAVANKKILVLGETGAGKSHLCNEITASNDFVVGHSLDSCTTNITTVDSYLFGDTSMPVAVSDTGGLSVSE